MASSWTYQGACRTQEYVFGKRQSTVVQSCFELKTVEVT